MVPISNTETSITTILRCVTCRKSETVMQQTVRRILHLFLQPQLCRNITADDGGSVVPKHANIRPSCGTLKISVF